MARLICRLPIDQQPSAQEARTHGIKAWLIGALLNAEGQVQLMTPADWRPDLPFCLEWQLQQPLSPRQEQAAAEQLRVWLDHPLHLRWRAQKPLCVHAPEQLSHPHWTRRRLQQDLGPDLVLWGLGPAADPLDGRYQQPVREWRCRRVNGERCDYESYLFHAHHQGSGAGLTLPAVLPWTDELEHSHTNLRASHYNEWLELAQAWADLRHGRSGDEPWVLVDGWEGHRRWWSPQAPPAPVAPATVSIPAKAAWLTPRETDPRPALVVHGFHSLELTELLSSLRGTEMALYVSTPGERCRDVEQLAERLGWMDAQIVAVENRGRDMAPFLLDLLPRVIACNHPWLLKLHTKRSSHLRVGEAWAAHLREHLASQAACRRFSERFAADEQLGLLAAPGTLLPSTISLHRNATHLHELLQALALPSSWWLEQPFVAGSMYAVSCRALEPLVQLPLSRDDFEAEDGQSDGTLAHALERLVAALVIREGLLVQELEGSAEGVPPFGYGWAAPA
jgi:hypothetical protein